MSVRAPAVAGQFYPNSASRCQTEIEGMLQRACSVEVPSGELIGGIVPHAGWIFSGRLAGEVVRVLCSHEPIETFVVFGAVHRFSSTSAGVMCSASAWQTPLGDMPVDEELAAAVARASSLITIDPACHQVEHSIEVQVPLIQFCAGDARLLPVMVPPSPAAPEVGRIVAEQAARLGRRAAYLGSTDLTHYGPRYHFTPMGVGMDALKWAKEVNDRRVLDLIVRFQADRIVAEAIEHHNACGSGAAAAAVEACRTAGADHACILGHTTSNEVAGGQFADRSDAVGYAGVVFSRSTT